MNSDLIASITAWKYEASKVVNPQLALPKLKKTIHKLKNINGDSFVYLVDAKILEFVKVFV